MWHERMNVWGDEILEDLGTPRTEENTLAHQRTRLAQVLSGLMVALGLVMSLAMFISGAPLYLALVGVGASASIFVASLAASRHPNVAVFVIVAAVQITIIAAALNYNGLASSSLLWITLTPLLATLLTGRFGGFVTFLTACAVPIGFFLKETYLPLNVPSAAQNPGLALTNLLAFTFLFWLLARFLDKVLEQGQVAARRFERERNRSERLEAIGQLAGGIAHDFNNLLTVIEGYAELILTDHSDDRSLCEDIETIRDAARRGASLTEKLLAYGRRQTLLPESIDAAARVATFVELIERVFPENIEIVADLPTRPTMIEMDPVRFEQVLMNVAVNARDAMPHGGHLRFEVSRCLDDESARITVEDTGVGMDEATLKRIFEPFFSTKPQDSGGGLGLSSVEGIIAQTGGHIEVESTPGEGTSLHFSVPCTDIVTVDAPAAPDHVADADAPGQENAQSSNATPPAPDHCVA